MTGDLNFAQPGWPRPVLDGRPVPVVTPVRDGRPQWKDVLELVQATCAREWLCQVCGLPLGEQGVRLLTCATDLTQGAALHQRCADLARAVCPRLAGLDGAIFELVTDRHGTPLNAEPVQSASDLPGQSGMEVHQ